MATPDRVSHSTTNGYRLVRISVAFDQVSPSTLDGYPFAGRILTLFNNASWSRESGGKDIRTSYKIEGLPKRRKDF